MFMNMKRERRQKSFSDSVMWSFSAPAYTVEEGSGASLPYWSKSFGWSRSRTDGARKKKVSFSKMERFSIINHPIEQRGRVDRYGACYAW